MSRYNVWNTHLKFYYFGINVFVHYLRLSKPIKIPIPIQMVWYYDVVEWNQGGMDSRLSRPPHHAISTWEQTVTTLKWSSDIIKDGGADKQTGILKLEY